MNRLAKAYKKFCDIELAVGAVLLISTVFILTFAAILRTIGFPINWGSILLCSCLPGLSM